MADHEAGESRQSVTREQLHAQVLEQAQDAVEAGKPAIMVSPEWLVELLTVATPTNTMARLGPEPLHGYSINQVADAFGRTYHAVWDWVRSGLLPGAHKFMEREC